MTSISLAKVDDVEGLTIQLEGYATDSSEEDLQDPFRRLELAPTRQPEITTGVSSITFTHLPKPISLYQDLSDGCGGKTWEAANVMIDYILWKNAVCSGAFLQGKKVIDLGSGTGLVGIAVALGCPNLDTMVLSDLLPMMKLLKKNIELNALESNTRAELICWGEEIPASVDFVPDVILASDCVYHENAFQPLLDTLVTMASHETDVYISYRKRRRADKRFFQMARKKFHFTEIMEDPQRSIYTKEGLKLYLLKKK